MKPAILFSLYHGSRLAPFTVFLKSLSEEIHNSPIHHLYVHLDGPISEELFSVLQLFKVQNPHLNLYCTSSTANQGLAKSMNIMLRQALADSVNLFFRVDTDDIISPCKFIYQLDYLNSNPDVDLVGTYFSYSGLKSSTPRLPLSSEQLRRAFCYRLVLCHPTVCFRSTYIDKAGFYPESCTEKIEDLLYWHEGFKAGAIFANIPYSLYKLTIDWSTLERRSKPSLILIVFLLRVSHISIFYKHTSFSPYLFSRALLELFGRFLVFLLCRIRILFLSLS